MENKNEIIPYDGQITKKGDSKLQPHHYLIIGLGCVAGFFIGRKIGQLIIARKTSNESEDFEQELKSGDIYSPTSNFNVELPKPKPETIKNNPNYTTATNRPLYSETSKFPLKKRSKGNLVKELQIALIKKYGVSIMPKYGADGYFGNELEKALISKGLPTTITESDFKLIVKPSLEHSTTQKNEQEKVNKTEPNNYNILAQSLYDSIVKDDIFKAIRVLKRIKNKIEYIYLNEKFKKKEFAGTSKTVVNALLQHFRSDTYRQKINDEFYRIGLKFDGSQWSLNGIENDQVVISSKKCTIWDDKGNEFTIPANQVLGFYCRAKNGVCEFLTTNGMSYYANSNAIQYYYDQGN